MSLGVMFGGSSSSDINGYDFLSEENSAKWSGIFTTSLNSVSMIRLQLSQTADFQILRLTVFMMSQSLDRITLLG